jgi:ribosomal protein S24E
MTFWDGMPFTVEWQGKDVRVLVTRDVIEDLARHLGAQPDAVYVQTFEEYRGMILDGVARAIVDPANFDKKGLLYIRHKDIEKFNS